MDLRSLAARRLVTVAAALSAVAVAVTACGGSPSRSGSSGTSGAQKHVNIAHFVAIQANPVEQVIIAAGQQVGKDQNATVTVFDSNNDVQRELANCQDAIASQKYDAFVLKAVSGPPLQSCARNAIAAGIPVVVQGTALGPDQTTAPQVRGIVGTVVTLSTTNGEAVADLANRACDSARAKPCRVIYLFGPVTFDYASITRQTFLNRVGTMYHNVQVVGQAAANFDADTAANQARQLMQLHPDVNVIVNACDPCAVATEKVVADLGRTGTVLVVGAGGSQVGVDAIKAGRQFGDTVILPASEAKAAVTMAIKAARHEPVGNTRVDVTRDLSPVGTIVDAQNVDRYQPEW
jgi:ribose transport system substrate-binding protein